MESIPTPRGDGSLHFHVTMPLMSSCPRHSPTTYTFTSPVNIISLTREDTNSTEPEPETSHGGQALFL